MEASGASTSRSSQPPPEPMSGALASGSCVGELAAAREGESASTMRDRVVSGIKALNRERDMMVKLVSDVKRLRKQREALHSSKRASMDEEIQQAKLRVEKQAEVLAMLEGQDGPLKEKCINDRRFGKSVKVEEVDETPGSDPLPPQTVARSPSSPQSSGGLLKVIQTVESPVRMERLVFSGEEIPEDMPDKVKPCKPQVSYKTIFVPFDDEMTATNVVSSGGDCILPSTSVPNVSLAEGLQVSSEPINLLDADSSMHAESAGLAAAQGCSSLQQQESGGTAPLGEHVPQEKTMDRGNRNVADNCSANAMNNPVRSVSGSVWGNGQGAPTFAQVVSSAPGSVTRPGQRVQRSSASGQTVPPQATTSAAPGPGFASWSSAGGRRRNVVILKWEGASVSPARRRVVDLILGMGFGARDLYALIHVDGTKDYTVSFTRPEGLDLFWERYEARCRSSPDWEGLAPVAVSVQSTIKKVTIILSNESVPAKDLEVWLRHYGEIISSPAKILDDRNIWTGGWSVTIRLAKDGNVVRHLPSSAFIGRDRMTIFYPGQPKLCHRCGEKGHYSLGCSALICTMCRGRGHVAKDCTEIRCNLCRCLGHPYSQCPEAWHNIEKEITEEFERLQNMDFSSSKPPSPVADPPGPVQVPSPAPAATPSVSVSLPPVLIPVSPQPSVSAPPVSVPSIPQESVSPRVSSPPESVPSNTLEDTPSLQEEVCVVGGTNGGATASSDRRAPAKSRAKAKNSQGSFSEDDLRYLEGKKGVRRKRRQKAQVVQAEEDPLPVSNRFGVLSGASESEAPSEGGEESDMECGTASRKREASGDEQQRGAKKPST